MARLKVNNASLEYSEKGSGQPLILVHGSASDSRIWENQVDEFGKHFRTIVYSRRYHWPNEPIPPATDYSMEEQVDDLQAFIKSLDAAPARLVGHSYGGFLSLLVAIREPSLVKNLVLAEPPVITIFVSDPPKPLEILKLLATRPRTAAAIIKFGAKGVAPAQKAFKKGDSESGIRIFGDAVFGKGGYDSFPKEHKEKIHDNLPTVKAELLGSGFLPLAPKDLNNIQIPALLLEGEKSIALFHRLNDRLEELLPNTERMEISGASHIIQQDNSSAFNAAVLSFLERHST